MLCEKYRDFLRWVVYQVYPRSFMDSNGDGVGDLPGVLKKLDYLKELGVNAIWLCPCFKSPNDDNGYDISDYRDIMDEFGTLEDMRALIAGLHARDMKLILDFVPNHTSTAHRWFRESRKGRDNPYSDYYCWYDTPPNDWKSAFGGSAWEYDEQRGQYYLHSYAPSQADLNWDNPAVVREMQAVIDYWVNLGVDGFRIDVIDQISKDIPDGLNSFGPHLHDYIRALFGRESTQRLFTVGECWVQDADEMERHCAVGRNELCTLFQFEHMECGREDKFTPRKGGMPALRDILVKWQGVTAERDLLYSLFTENHDQPPLISRVADDGARRYESATCLAAMLYLMKGVPFIYQGQEIGMPSPGYDRIEDFRDIESLNGYQALRQTMTDQEAIEKISFGSRDNSRRPMAWDGSANGGFTTGTPWIPLHSRQREINLEADLASAHSVYRFYQALLRLRRENDAFLDGDFACVSRPEDNHFVYTRQWRGENWAVICNFDEAQAIALPFICEAPVLSNLGRKSAAGVYQPFECAVCRMKT